MNSDFRKTNGLQNANCLRKRAQKFLLHLGSWKQTRTGYKGRLRGWGRVYGKLFIGREETRSPQKDAFTGNTLLEIYPRVYYTRDRTN